MVRSLAALAMTILLVAPVSAASLDQAKAAKHVCEQNNGYLQVMPGAPGGTQALVDSINAQRKAAYGQIGAKNGITADQVGVLTAQKVIKQAPQNACR